MISDILGCLLHIVSRYKSTHVPWAKRMDTRQPRQSWQSSKHHPHSFFHLLYTLQGTNISPKNGIFEDDFPFPKVGYVNSLEGIAKRAATGTSLQQPMEKPLERLRRTHRGPRLQHIFLDALRKCSRGTTGKESHDYDYAAMGDHAAE